MPAICRRGSPTRHAEFFRTPASSPPLSSVEFPNVASPLGGSERVKQTTSSGVSEARLGTEPKYSSSSEERPRDLLLEVEGLRKHFPIRRGLLKRVVGHVKAVDGVSFTLRRGET